MASAKAIEAAEKAWFSCAVTADRETHWGAALAAASAIDGDFNAGIEACQEYLRSIHHTNTADMLEKLKR